MQVDDTDDPPWWSMIVASLLVAPVSNPPWSLFKKLLQHEMTIAEHVAFLVTVNHWWARHRRELVRAAGFDIERIIECDAPQGMGRADSISIGDGSAHARLRRTLHDGDADSRRPRTRTTPRVPLAPNSGPSGTQTRTHTHPGDTHRLLTPGDTRTHPRVKALGASREHAQGRTRKRLRYIVGGAGRAVPRRSCGGGRAVERRTLLGPEAGYRRTRDTPF